MTSQNTETATPTLAERLQQARGLVQSGELESAEWAYGALLAESPDEIEAIDFLAVRALGRKQTERAIEMLEQATQRLRETQLFRTLGLAYIQARRFDEAIAALRTALTIAPGNYVARLFMGLLLEKLGSSYGALTNYFGAITLAQQQGQWHDEATTPPWIRHVVKPAMKAVIKGRRDLFHGVLAPLRARYGPEALARVEKALSYYLLDERPDYGDPRQRPTFLFLPGLPALTYLKKEWFDWMPQLEAQTAAIREELSRLMGDRGNFEPFHRHLPNEGYLAGTRGAPAWDTYFLFRHGERIADHLAACPNTAAALDKVPLPRVRDHAPEVLFSVLQPGTHIKPHRGVTNTRVVVHLPLIVPEDCAIVVGGDKHVWQEGQCVAFDDTYEHEAWNRSDRPRGILLFDVWNPYLTEAECAALGDLVAAIGDFNNDCGLHSRPS